MRCARANDAARLPIQRIAGSLTGDIDGDGRLDRVTVRYDPQASASCPFLVAVTTGTSVLAAPLAVTGRYSTQPLPALNRLARVPRRGLAIAVDVSSGSARWAAVFVVADGRLSQVKLASGAFDGAFVYSGALMHDYGVDCFGGGRSGRLVVSGWRQVYPKPIQVDRTVYRLVGAQLRRVRSTHGTAARPPRYPELRGSGLFTSCTAASR
jgi:hypothetical protein